MRIVGEEGLGWPGPGDDGVGLPGRHPHLGAEAGGGPWTVSLSGRVTGSALAARGQRWGDVAHREPLIRRGPVLGLVGCAEGEKGKEKEQLGWTEGVPGILDIQFFG